MLFASVLCVMVAAAAGHVAAAGRPMWEREVVSVPERGIADLALHNAEVRKRDACHEETPEQILQTFFYHKDETTCGADKNPVFVVEQPFNFCTSQDGVKFYKYRVHPQDPTKYQQCTFDTMNGGDACCVVERTGTCEDANVPLQGGCNSVFGTLRDDGMMMNSMKATNRLVPLDSVTLQAPPGTPRKTLFREEYPNADCSGKPSVFNYTGCHQAEVALHGAGAYAHFENQWKGTPNAPNVPVEARYCLYFHGTCDDIGRPAYSCRRFTEIDNCETDGNMLSHRIRVVDAAASTSTAATRTAVQTALLALLALVAALVL